MVNRLKNLWHGKIVLPKTFWFFGVVLLLLISFIFISIQTIIASVFGKFSDIILYLDYFLAALSAVYGLFIMVAVWRSANKYQGSKLWVRLSKVSSIFIVLWLVINLGLYVYIKTLIPPAFEAKMDYTPKKLYLAEPNMEGDAIYIGAIKINFPFDKEDIRDVRPFFHEDRFFNMTINLANKSGKGYRGNIMFECFSFSDEPKMLNWLLNYDPASLSETARKIHYARLRDYSWWNLIKNVRLSMNLILKALSITAGNFSTIMAYETESPYLKGLLIDHRSEKNRRSIEFSFEWRGKTYSIFAFISDEELSKKIMGMISAIRPIDDMNNSYNEMETLYKNKDKARYPEEVLLLSLISIKGPTINNMNALLKIEESKQNNQHAIDAIEGEIDFLMRSQTQKP